MNQLFNMLCQLCLQEKKLLKKSHIIPNFLYKDIFGTDNRLVNINMDNFDEYNYTHSGFYDKNILCADCDGGILCKLETYASNCLYFRGSTRSRSEIQTQLLGGGEILQSVRFHNLDYTKIKLFLLSILWRAHVSRQSFFKEVNLGPYAEQLRKMIFDGNAGEEDEFEVILLHVDTANTRAERALYQPRKLRGDGNYQYAFIINRIIYHYNVSKYNKMDIYKKAIIKRDGIIDIGLLKNEIARNYLDSVVGKKILLKSKPVW